MPGLSGASIQGTFRSLVLEERTDVLTNRSSKVVGSACLDTRAGNRSVRPNHRINVQKPLRTPRTADDRDRCLDEAHPGLSAPEGL